MNENSHLPGVLRENCYEDAIVAIADDGKSQDYRATSDAIGRNLRRLPHVPPVVLTIGARQQLTNHGPYHGVIFDESSRARSRGGIVGS